MYPNRASSRHVGSNAADPVWRYYDGSNDAANRADDAANGSDGPTAAWPHASESNVAAARTARDADANGNTAHDEER